MHRSDFLDIIKGILIMLVCIGHASQYAIHQNGGFWQDPLYKAIYMFHMPLFMAVAGYLFFGGLAKAVSLTHYVTYRSVALLVPIFSWTILYKITFFFITDKIAFEQLPLEIIRYAVTSQWFLWALFGSIVLTAIAVSAGKYRTFLIVILFLTSLALPEVPLFSLFKYILLFFIAGFYFASCKGFSERNVRVLLLPLAIGSCLGFMIWEKDTYVYVTGMTLVSDNIPNIMTRWLVGGVVSIFFVSFLFCSYSVIPTNIRKMLILAGKNSIYIYILQAVMFKVILKPAYHFLPPVSSIVLGDLLAVLIGVLVTYACLFMGNIISLNKTCAFLLFGKKLKNDPKRSFDLE